MEETMYRKFLLIVAAIVGVAFAPAGALAARGGGGRGGFVGEAGEGLLAAVAAVSLGAVAAVLLVADSEALASEAARFEVAEAGVGDTLLSGWGWVSVWSALAITTVATRTTATAAVGSALSRTAHMGQSFAVSGSATDLLRAVAPP